MRLRIRDIYKMILRKNVIALQQRIIRRWNRIEPDAEVVIMCLPKNSREERERIIDNMRSIFLSQDYQDFCDGKGRWVKNEEKGGKKNGVKFI